MPDLRGKVAKPLSRLAKTGALAPAEVAAALVLENAVVSLQGPDALRRAPWTRAAGGSPGGFPEERVLRDLDDRRFYERWLSAMTAEGLAAGPVLDVIVEGKALSAIDRDAGKRKGWAHSRLKHALRLAAALRAGTASRKSA